MDTIVLWNYADEREGSVEVREWGVCNSEKCYHLTHDQKMKYYVTRIRGRILWEGEFGEQLVQSDETGRLFFTRYFDRGNYAPAMFTEELTELKTPLPPKFNKVLNYYRLIDNKYNEFWKLWEDLKQSWPKSKEVMKDEHSL
jgi:hypothetical protein